jgi:uncharacterized protein (DUF1499 family)
MVAQVRDVLQRRDDAAAAHAGHFVLEALDRRGLRAGDAEQQVRRAVEPKFPSRPPLPICVDVSIPAMFDWRRPDNLGVTNGRLAPCRRTPNCVSSQADPSDREHYIAPIPFRGDAMAAVRRAVAAMPRAKVISEKENYLYAEFRSKLLGYVDDVEFFYDGAAIQVRSASRLGRRDFNVNRNRVEQLRAMITRP